MGLAVQLVHGERWQPQRWRFQPSGRQSGSVSPEMARLQRYQLRFAGVAPSG